MHLVETGHRKVSVAVVFILSFCSVCRNAFPHHRNHLFPSVQYNVKLTQHEKAYIFFLEKENAVPFTNFCLRYNHNKREQS